MLTYVGPLCSQSKHFLLSGLAPSSRRSLRCLSSCFRLAAMLDGAVALSPSDVGGAIQICWPRQSCDGYRIITLDGIFAWPKSHQLSHWCQWLGGRCVALSRSPKSSNARRGRATQAFPVCFVTAGISFGVRYITSIQFTFISIFIK